MLSERQAEAAVRAWSQEPGSEIAWTARLILREVQRERQRYRAATSGSAKPRWPQGEIPLASGTPGRGNPEVGGVEAQAESRSFHLEIGPQGARVEVRVQQQTLGGNGAGESREASSTNGAASVNGATVTEVFEAPTMGLLLEQHPELAQQLSQARVLPQSGLFKSRRNDGSGDSGGLGALVAPLAPEKLGPPAKRRLPTTQWFDAEAGGIRTDVLGVLVKEVETDKGARRLLVDRVYAGTIAEVVELRRGDYLVEINGAALKQLDDVTRVLEGRAEDDSLRIRLERGDSQQVLTWKPAPRAQDD